MKSILTWLKVSLLLLIANFTFSQTTKITCFNGTSSFNIISSTITTVFDPDLIILSKGTASLYTVQKPVVIPLMCS